MTLQGFLFGETTFGSATFGDPLGGTITVPNFATAPLVAEPVSYTSIQLSWTLPTSGYLLQLVRNCFSAPSDQNDGEVIAQFSTTNGTWPTSSYLDASFSGANGGIWIYYSLFMLTSMGGYWLRSSDAECMLPASWGSAARMFSLLPGYYQNLDNTMFDPFFISEPSSTWEMLDGLTWGDLVGAK